MYVLKAKAVFERMPMFGPRLPISILPNTEKPHRIDVHSDNGVISTVAGQPFPSTFFFDH